MLSKSMICDTPRFGGTGKDPAKNVFVLNDTNTVAPAATLWSALSVFVIFSDGPMTKSKPDFGFSNDNQL